MAKLLYIWYKRPGTVMEGGGQCSVRNYNCICSAIGKENVESVYIHDDDSRRPLTAYLQAALFMPFGYFFGLTPAKCKAIVRKAMNYDYVFIDRSLFGIVAKYLKKAGYKGKIITFFHNVEKVYFAAKLSGAPSFLKNIVVRVADKNDRYTCGNSDVIIALNERDACTIRELYGRQSDVIIPISLPDKLKQADDKQLTQVKPRCVFLGAYFAANNEGLLWFVNNVLPFVDVDFKIIGKGMSKLKQERKELQRIEVISDAPDLYPYFVDADMMILPIFGGSGMKVKTCESLMFGKNIIGTDEAFEGYNIDGQKVGGRCNTAQEFIDAIKSFVAQPRTRFNQYSRQLYLDNFSYMAVQKKFDSLFK